MSRFAWFVDGAMVIVPTAISFNGPLLIALLIAANVAVIVITGLFARTLAIGRRTALRQPQVQALQLGSCCLTMLRHRNDKLFGIFLSNSSVHRQRVKSLARQPTAMLQLRGSTFVQCICDLASECQAPFDLRIM